MTTIMVKVTSLHDNNELWLNPSEWAYFIRTKPISTLLIQPDQEKQHTVIGIKNGQHFKVLESPEELFEAVNKVFAPPPVVDPQLAAQKAE